MSDEKQEQNDNPEVTNSEAEVEDQDVQAETSEETIDEESDEQTEDEVAEDEAEKLHRDLADAKDKYLRLFSEFENFRRRTARERLDLIQTSTEGLMVELLPILDDFARAKNSLETGNEVKSVEEGIKLIENKLRRILEQKSLKPMAVKQGDDFNPDLHEAVSQIPAPKKKLTGKVVEVLEDGYFLGEKVIRYAKVVIGS